MLDIDFAADQLLGTREKMLKRIAVGKRRLYMPQTWTAVTGLFFFFGASAWAQAPGVTVHKTAPTVSQRTFDPKHPPRDIPVMIPDEAGLAHYEYTTDIAVDGDTDVLGRAP
jgi:hypothetical protein